jgi:hypothetical protein
MGGVVSVFFFRRGSRLAEWRVKLLRDIRGQLFWESARRVGHLITLDWSKNKLSIVSQVSLFNLMTYSVLLAKDYSGNDFVYREGSFFNIVDNNIYPLIPGDRITSG